jgi:hypothetical protein
LMEQGDDGFFQLPQREISAPLPPRCPVIEPLRVRV